MKDHKNCTVVEYEEDFDIIKLLFRLEKKLEQTVEDDKRKQIEKLIKILSLGRNNDSNRI